MDNSKQSKQILLSVIGVAILVVAVVGVSFAFFNYTRAGQENTVGTGKIWFTSSQDKAASITDFFPQIPGQAAQDQSDTVKVTITGGTSYARGMTYRLRAVDVKSNGVAYDPTAAGNVPILLDVAVDPTEGGTVNDTTHGTFTATTPTGGTAGVAIPLVENAILGTGTIVGNTTGATSSDVNGKIKVTAYIDSNVAITDTLTSDTAPSGYQNGTTTDWLEGRTRVTTEQWNALGQHPVSFRILVEAIETGGAYVDGTFPRGA